MKPATLTHLTLAALLSAASLCAGARYYLDVRSSAEDENHAVIHRTDIPGEIGQVSPVKRVVVTRPGESSAQAMARVLRPLFHTTSRADLLRSLLTLTAAFQPDDWAAALDCIHGMELPVDSDPCSLMLLLWVRADRPAALDWAEKHEALRPLIDDWQATDPSGAQAWLKDPARHHDEAWLEQLKTPVASWKDDLFGLKLSLAGLSPADVRAVLKKAQLRLSPLPAGELGNWLGSLSPSVRTEAILQLYDNAEIDTQGQMTLLNEGERWLPAETVAALQEEWARTHPKEGALLLEQTRDATRRRAIIKGVTRKLMPDLSVRDPFELFREHRQELDDADILSLARDVILGTNSYHACTLFDELASDELRENGYRVLTASLFDENPESARYFLKTSKTIPDKIRREFSRR